MFAISDVTGSGPSAAVFVLSGDERAELVRWAALPERRRADRARIVPACAEGMPNAAAARELEVAVKSVSKWRRRFAEQRLAGLEDDAPIGRPKAGLVLSGAERAQLERWARRAKTAQYLAMRAKIVLACAGGAMNKQVAVDLGVDESTVDRWRARFVERRLNGLHDEPRPGRPPSVRLDQVEDVIVATLDSLPGKDTHWSRSGRTCRCRTAGLRTGRRPGRCRVAGSTAGALIWRKAPPGRLSDRRPGLVHRASGGCGGADRLARVPGAARQRSLESGADGTAAVPWSVPGDGDSV
jgi:transposase